MAAEHIYECEVRQWHEDETTRKRARRWAVISVEEALRLGDDIRRCKECHGPIRLHRAAAGSRFSKFVSRARPRRSHAAAFSGSRATPRSI